MKHIEAQDGDNIAVTIQDIFVQKTHPKEGDSKVIVKVIGTTEDGETGESTLWLTDEIWQGETKSSVTKALELLESLGMENQDIHNMATLIGKDATFRASVKGDKVNFFQYGIQGSRSGSHSGQIHRPCQAAQHEDG